MTRPKAHLFTHRFVRGGLASERCDRAGSPRFDPMTDDSLNFDRFALATGLIVCGALVAVAVAGVWWLYS